MYELLDWNKLPTNLAYLAAPAETYGRFQFEDKIFDFLRRMSESEKRELTAIQRRSITDEAQIDAWLDQYPMTKHPESRLVYFLEHLLWLGDDAGFFPIRGGEEKEKEKE